MLESPPLLCLLTQKGKTWLYIDGVKVCRVGDEGELYFLDRDRRRCKELDRWEVCVTLHELIQLLVKDRKE